MELTKQVVFIAKEDSIEQLKALLETMIEPSRAEDGCLLYNIYQQKSEPSKFVVIETWESEQKLKGHQNSSHYKHYKANYEQFIADKYSEELDILS